MRRRVRVELAGVVVAESDRPLRILETSHPPTYYLHPDDVDMSRLSPQPHTSWCEWKGHAVYWTVSVGGATAVRAAWSYPQPSGPYEKLADHLSFYPALLQCSVDGAAVQPQPGGFYGGWITPDVTGPFKGVPGSARW